MFKKYVHVMQDGIMDCGVCALLTIIKTYGGNVSKEYLRELTHTDREGTNAFHLLEAGKTLGFDTKALKGNVLDLPQNLLPCIAHVVIDDKYKHFIVIQKIDKKKQIIIVSDPACGIKKYTLEDYNKITTNQYLIFIPCKPIPTLSKNKELYQSIVKVLLQYKSIFISIFIFSLLYTIISIITSFHFQLIIDHAINYASKMNLYFVMVMMLFLYILKITIDWIRNHLLNFMNHTLDHVLISNIFKHIILLPYLYYKNRTTGEIVARINDLGDIKEAISELFMTVFVDLILVIVVFFTLYQMNSYLSLIGLCIALLYLILIKLFHKILKNYIVKYQEAAANVNSYMIESINNIDTVKSLGIEEQVMNKMNIQYNHYLNTGYKFQRIYALENLIKDLIHHMGLLLVILISALYVINGKMSLGEMITYHAMIIYFLEPIKNVIQMELIWKKTKVSIQRVIELYELKKESLNMDKKYSGKPIKGHIKIKHLNYSYYGRKNVLEDVNLNIDAGNKVIIYGNSGSGKSTIGKILMKFLEVGREQVYIDDKDINDFNILDIRREICYIGQNENLFSDSIYNNVVLNRNIQYDTFLKVAYIAKIDEMISKRNASYDMVLEENGFNISGGERQRIILARSLLKNSSIYILDESLSQLDVPKEREILQELFKKYKDKTFIYISHRFHNIDLFDQKINIGVYSNA